MSYITKGGFELVGGRFSIQPERSIIQKNDGTLEGSIMYRAHRSNQFAIPGIGANHYDDPRLEMYQRTVVANNLDYVTVTGSFFGIISSKTDPVVDYAGGQNNDPIESHPDFESFAGTPSSPKNGAFFDESGIFIGFVGASDDPENAQFRGTQYYLTPSTLVSLSYWTDRTPSLKKRMTIVESISGFKKPSGVKNFLLLDTPYRQVGSFYQVTEQYLGSGDKGWNPLVYNG